MLDGAQVIVDYLIREKVPYAFGLCGHGNIQFIDALYERSNDIKTISVHHETVAGFMADVYYRVSGQPTATFTSCGPGSANLPIALGNSFLDSVPFLAVTGNMPTSQFNRGAFQELYRHYQADFPSTVRAYCKRVFQPTRGEMVPLAVRQAWKTMVTGRPGPVVLDVPFDVFREAAAEETPEAGGVERQHLVPLRRRSGGREEGGRHAAGGRAPGDPGRPGRQVWRRRRRPAGARREAADSGRVVGERPRRHRRVASAGARPRRPQRRLSGEPRDPAGRRAARARRALRRPHLELVAARLFLHHPADQAHPCRHRSRRDRPQLSGRARPDGRRAHLPAPGARRARRAARTSTQRAAARAKWLDAIAGYRKEWEAFVAPGFVDDASPINPQRAAHEIDKALPADAILVSDIGIHHNWLIQFCKPRRPDSLIGSMGFGPMGFGVAGVLGAKLAAPDRPCVSVCGDGAFFMHASVLGTAVEYNIPVVWVVWNNYAYASIRGLQRGYLGRPRARDRLPASRHRRALQSGLRRHGALRRRRGRAHRPRRRSRRRRAQAGIATGRPYLIDAQISADRNPGGAGVWELPGLGQSQPAIGGRYQPNVIWTRQKRPQIRSFACAFSLISGQRGEPEDRRPIRPAVK